MTSETDKPALSTAVDSLPEETQRVIEAEVERIPNLPRQAKDQVFAIIARHSVEHHSGPLPPPRMLAGYEETLPGAAERIMAMAERDLAHMHAMQVKIVEDEAGERSRGQWLGATVTIVALGASTWMA